MQDVLADLFHLDIFLGAIVDCQSTDAVVLELPVTEAIQSVRQAPNRHADETGWREGGKLAWLWVAVISLPTVFLTHGRRTTEAAQQPPGLANGCLVSDRCRGYSWWPLWLRRICWAHVIRDFTAISERPDEAGRLGRDLLAEVNRVFSWWHAVRDGTLSRNSFKTYMRVLRERVRLLLVKGRDSCPDPRTARTCMKLLKVFPALWYFENNEGVEPTNNAAAEQAVRWGVILRKLTLGTKCEAGSRFVERILTVRATLRQQKRNTLTFIKQACEAKLQGTLPPSLPPSASASQD